MWDEAIIRVAGRGELIVAGKRYPCAVGENGFTGNPREGDKATPLGMYPLRECWFRADRMSKPETSLPLHEILENDGWCDDPGHADYNRHVKLPFPASHENLWRQDNTYDIIVPIGFNDSPVTPGKGSAIFFHLARPGYTPTLGCVAVALPDMLEILPRLAPGMQIAIAPVT